MCFILCFMVLYGHKYVFHLMFYSVVWTQVCVSSYVSISINIKSYLS